MWSRNFSWFLILILMAAREKERVRCEHTANVSMVGDDGRQYRWVSCKGAGLPRISNTPNNIDYNTNVRPFGWLSTCMHVYGSVWFFVFAFGFFFLLFHRLACSLCVQYCMRIWTSDGRARRVRCKVDVVTKNRKRNGYSMTTQIQYVRRTLHGGWRLGTTHNRTKLSACVCVSTMVRGESKWQE